MILVGPPGAGKTLLSRALPGLLPPLSLREPLEEGHVTIVRARNRAALPGALHAGGGDEPDAPAAGTATRATAASAARSG